MANVLPVLMFKPSYVVLFATPEEKRSADNLQKLFQSKSISVKRIDGLNAYDFTNFKKIVSEELNSSVDETWLNITGGTKLMALAAYEAFAEKNKRIIYCDTEHQHIITLSPENKIENLIAEITISDYLLSYGYHIKETKDLSIVTKFYPLFDFILKNNLINDFISFYQEIREIHFEDHLNKQIKRKNFHLYKNFDTYTFLFDPKNKKSFSVSNSKYKSGDWLEYYIYYILKGKYKLEPLTGVKIISDENVENEIDVLVLKDYKLYNYSCKSGKSDNQFDLFQLETLRNITSGTFGKGIFVTTKKGSKRFLERAKELNVKIINVSNHHEQLI
jgi:hypothetical protein